MYDIADLWTPRVMQSRGLSNRNWLSDPQDGCHAGEAGCCRMMLASAVLGKSMLGGGLLSHFHPADMPFRSIPAKLLVGTVNGRRSEQHEAESERRQQAPSCGVSAHGGDSS